MVNLCYHERYLLDCYNIKKIVTENPQSRLKIIAIELSVSHDTIYTVLNNLRYEPCLSANPKRPEFRGERER